jgi:membrane protein implicated in regulation of membrane protease activity
MTALHALYIAATVFGAGVTVVDMLGVLGSQAGEEGDGEGGDDEGDDVGDEEGDGGEEDVEGEAGDDTGHPSVVAHDLRSRNAQRWIVRGLTALRTLVYFSLGFGPVGWFAFARYSTAATTLLWSVPSGMVVMVGARLLRRLMRRELDSQVSASEMLMEKGEVTVTIPEGQMGKVRVSVGGTYVDRYARSKGPERIAVGTTVRVVDVGDECIYVEAER